MKFFRSRGIIAFDDFGTGASSLTLLQLSIDEAKVDHSFLTNILTNRDCRYMGKYILRSSGERVSTPVWRESERRSSTI